MFTGSIYNILKIKKRYCSSESFIDKVIQCNGTLVLWKTPFKDGISIYRIIKSQKTIFLVKSLLSKKFNLIYL